MPELRPTLYIVEDDEHLREDLVRVVAARPQLALLGSTGSAQEALRFLRSAPALDVLLVDLGLPDGDGAEPVRALGALVPQARALVISVFADDWRVLDALSAGARGYLLKDMSDDELVRAVLEVARGDAPLSPQVARYLLRLLGQPAAPTRASTPAIAPAPRPEERLTTREAEILSLVARGHSGPEVADHLGLSMHTVNTHLRNAHVKLSARNRQQAILRARQSGQIG